MIKLGVSGPLRGLCLNQHVFLSALLSFPRYSFLRTIAFFVVSSLPFDVERKMHTIGDIDMFILTIISISIIIISNIRIITYLLVLLLLLLVIITLLMIIIILMVIILLLLLLLLLLTLLLLVVGVVWQQ